MQLASGEANMKKEIATIHIYANDGEDGFNGSRKVSGLSNEYEIVLGPKEAAKVGESYGPVKNPPMQDVLAHELGHIVSMITHDPTHDEMLKLFTGLVPGELRAWRFAENIVPELDRDFANYAVDTYRRKGL